VPEELTAHLFAEVKELEKNWRTILADMFGLLNLSERKNLAHPFWKTYKRRKVNE
jgi:hypothetical protein